MNTQVSKRFVFVLFKIVFAEGGVFMKEVHTFECVGFVF